MHRMYLSTATGLAYYFLFRCILFLTTTVYGSHVGVTLLSVSAAALTLVTISLFTGGVYKSRLVGTVEAFFILNLGVLALGTFYVQLTGGNQTALAFTSVSIAFSMFAGEVTYRSFLKLQGTKLWGKLPDLKVWYRCFDCKKTSETVDDAETVSNVEAVRADQAGGSTFVNLFLSLHDTSY